MRHHPSPAIQRSLDIIDEIFLQAPTLHYLTVTKATTINTGYGTRSFLPVGKYLIVQPSDYRNATMIDEDGNILAVDRLSSFSVMIGGYGTRTYSNGFIQTRDNYPSTGDEKRMERVMQKVRMA